MSKIILIRIIGICHLVLCGTALGNPVGTETNGLTFCSKVRTGYGAIPSARLASGEILGTHEEIVRVDRVARGKRVVLKRMKTNLEGWTFVSNILEENDLDVDVGDGSLYVDGGRIFYIYRLNKFSGKYVSEKYYSIRVKISDDNGFVWRDHSVVEEYKLDRPIRAGLWTPSLLRTKSAKLQAYYDDGLLPEDTLKRKNAGQWGVMKTWVEGSQSWGDRVIVSRPEKHLTGPKSVTADGARTPIEIKSGHLWVPVESNFINRQGERHIVLRYAESTDDGKTWSWERGGSPILYGLPPVVNGFQKEWSWPLASRGVKNDVLVVFRSNQDQVGNQRGTSHQVDKSLYYLWRLSFSSPWTIGRIPFVGPMIDHGTVALINGGHLVAGRNKGNPREYSWVRCGAN